MLQDDALNKYLIALNAKCQPTVLAQIFDVNVNTLYQELAKGAYGDPQEPLTEKTYLDIFRHFRTYHVKNTESKIRKAELEAELKTKTTRIKLGGTGTGSAEDLSLQDLQIKSMSGRIRLDRANETKIYFDLAERRQALLDAKVLLSMTTPFIQAIKNQLVSLALAHPNIASEIDKILNEGLADLGEKLLAAADKEKATCLQELLDADLSEDAIELGLLPEDV